LAVEKALRVGGCTAQFGGGLRRSFGKPIQSAKLTANGQMTLAMSSSTARPKAQVTAISDQRQAPSG
jgi:hypothetical protein